MKLGVVKTPDWRNLILREGSGLCNRGCNESEISEDEEEEVINGVRDSLRHILFECTALGVARAKWTRTLVANGGKWDLQNMFTCKQTFEIVVGFLQETGLFSLLV
jgi:hypothetical protein